MLPSSADWISDLAADVREVGDGKDVHHAPGLVGGVAARASRPIDLRTALRAPSQPTT